MIVVASTCLAPKIDSVPFRSTSKLLRPDIYIFVNTTAVPFLFFFFKFGQYEECAPLPHKYHLPVL